MTLRQIRTRGHASGAAGEGPPAPLGPLPAAAGELRAALARAGYDEVGLEALLGAPDVRLGADEQRALWTWRARGPEPRAVLARLFLLQRAVRVSDARRALGATALEAALKLGLVRRHGLTLAPRAQLSAQGGLLVASDTDPRRGPARRDQVHGLTTATLLLDRMTVRRPVHRALDLGTGTGYLALRLAGHCDAVWGTDVSERALAFARRNAALCAVENVRFLRSDRFRALGHERFDLVTANLPFVISPERRHIYRDAGAPGDSFLASVVRAAGRHLEEGGIAQLLGQWVHRDGDDEEQRAASWLLGTGCDALVVRLEREPVDVHAARWISGPAPLGPAERQARMERWMAAFRRARIRAVSTGLWTLRRRSADRHVMAIEDASPAAAPSAEEIARWMERVVTPRARR